MPPGTMKVLIMPMCTTRRDGAIVPHTRGGVGGQVADDQDNTQRDGEVWPHGNTARPVVDNLDAEGSGQQKV